MAERLTHRQMALRVAAELAPGHVVGLGPGLPEAVGDHVPADAGIILYRENGFIGYAPKSLEPILGGAIVDQAESFGLVRGGNLDAAVVEAHRVSAQGDLVDASAVDGSPSGAVDIVSGARRLIAVMEHTDPDGAPRIVRALTPPLTGRRCVDLIVTDVAVFQVGGDGLLLRELAPGWTVEDVRDLTEATLNMAPDIREMEFPRPREGAVNKVYPDGGAALADIPEGSVVMLDGFAGPGGTAQYLIVSLRDQGARGLTMISNTAGIARVAAFGTPPGFRAIDHSLLVDNGQVKKAVASFPVSPSPSRPNAFELAYKRGDAELELVPQGTLAERIRAGAFGIKAFYTPTGAGTLIAQGKETRVIDGREHLLEYGLRADYALIRAHTADTTGNLVYKGTSRNFNAVMAPAAAVTIAEVDRIVEAGALDPDAIVTPGVFVQRIVLRPPDFQPFERIE